MFQRFLIWLDGVISKMISPTTIGDKLKVRIAISPRMMEFLLIWTRMYENLSPWKSETTKTLNIPAAIAAEISRAVTIEMVVNVTDGASAGDDRASTEDVGSQDVLKKTGNGDDDHLTRAVFLNQQIQKLVRKMRIQMEFACAKGGMIFKPYVDGDDIAIDCVQADMFYPVEFDSNGNVTACVFADFRQIGQFHYVRLEYHAHEQGDKYTIRNTAFRSNTPYYNSISQNSLGIEVPLSDVPAWADIQPETNLTGIEKPLFAYFRYPMANQIDPTSALGVSCYSRAVELIEEADLQWSNLLWEFESGQRALYVDALAFTKDSLGNPMLPNKRLYRTLNQSAALGGDDMFEDWSPSFREQQLLNGLEAILRRIEFACGIAYGTLSNPTVVEKTATEIKTAQQRTYATITDCQKALQNALESLLYAMDVWTTLYNLAPAGDFQSTFNFDDSLVSDANVKFLQDTQALGLNVMGKVEFRMRNYGETKEIAQQAIADVMAEMAASMGASMFPPNPAADINKPPSVALEQKSNGF